MSYMIYWMGKIENPIRLHRKKLIIIWRDAARLCRSSLNGGFYFLAAGFFFSNSPRFLLGLRRTWFSFFMLTGLAPTVYDLMERDMKTLLRSPSGLFEKKSYFFGLPFSCDRHNIYLLFFLSNVLYESMFWVIDYIINSWFYRKIYEECHVCSASNNEFFGDFWCIFIAS